MDFSQSIGSQMPCSEDGGLEVRKVEWSDGATQPWVQTLGNPRVQFTDVDLFPISKRMNERRGARKQSDHGGASK